MTVAEIFTKINSHMIEGIMFHDQMAEYYDFLNFHGFKRCHEYHAISEFVERRAVVRYYLNHYNKLIDKGITKDPEVIPVNWRNYARQEIDSNTKKRAIRDGFIRWHDWETETKKLYEQSYEELMKLNEVAAACKIGELVKNVDKELKKVDHKCIEYNSIDYDLSTIYCCQNEMHKKFKKKMGKFHVKMC